MSEEKIRKIVKDELEDYHSRRKEKFVRILSFVFWLLMGMGLISLFVFAMIVGNNHQKSFCELNNMSHNFGVNDKCFTYENGTINYYEFTVCPKEFSREHEYCFESYAGYENNLK